MSDDARRRAAETLGVAETADAAEVQRAFRMAVHEVHPDRGGSEDQMRELLAARRLLSSGDSSGGGAAPGRTTAARTRRFYRRRGLRRYWNLLHSRMAPQSSTGR